MVLPHEQETEHGEFSCGVIHALKTEHSVGWPRAIERHLPPTPMPAPAPAPVPVPAPSTATPPLKLQKKDIQAIKTKEKTLLCHIMLHTESVSPMQKKRDKHISSALRDARIDVVTNSDSSSIAIPIKGD
ncbi:hypothetical protein BDR06DRAFT_965361 [Suillus hirtellus]|nr:hypothetical protein BDR06DRAFT_965361 [Suillus hirtellus]